MLACFGKATRALETEDVLGLRGSVPSIHGRTPGPQFALPSGLNNVSSSSPGLVAQFGPCKSPGEVASIDGRLKDERDDSAAEVRRELSVVIGIGQASIGGDVSGPREDERMRNMLRRFLLSGTIVIEDDAAPSVGRRASSDESCERKLSRL